MKSMTILKNTHALSLLWTISHPCVFVSLSLWASLCIYELPGMSPHQSWGCRSGYPASLSGGQSLPEGNRICRVRPLLGHSFIPAPNSALEIPWRSHHKIGWGGRGTAALSSLPSDTPVMFNTALIGCISQWLWWSSHVDNDPTFIMCLCTPEWVYIIKTTSIEHNYGLFIDEHSHLGCC